MADQNIAIYASAPPNTTVLTTVPIDHSARELIATRWYFTSPGPSFLYSAWLHPDTTTPSLDDPTNIMITREATFILKNAADAAEHLPQCIHIPDTHKNMTLQLKNNSAFTTQEARVSYLFQ